VGAAFDEAKKVMNSLEASTFVTSLVIPAEKRTVLCASGGSSPIKTTPGIGSNSLTY